MGKTRNRPGRWSLGGIALGTAIALGLGLGGALVGPAAAATTGATARINAYGGPMCPDGGASVRVTLAVKPRVGSTVLKVVDKHMALTNVEPAANAWLVHLK